IRGGVPPTARYRLAKGAIPLGEKSGMTHRKSKSVTPSPTANTASPKNQRPFLTAYQIPKLPTPSGNPSLVVHASRGTTENATSRSSSRNQMAYNTSGTAIATEWKLLVMVNALNCVAG